MLWVTYFMGLVIYYVLLSWMPTLMLGMGYPLAESAAHLAVHLRRYRRHSSRRVDDGPLGGAQGGGRWVYADHGAHPAARHGA